MYHQQQDDVMKSIMRIALVSLVFLAGCATTGGVVTTPKTMVFQIEQNYKVAQDVAVVYEGLPDCGPKGVVLCSKPDVRAKIKKANDAALIAFQGAENAVNDPTFDQSKLSAIVAIAEQAVFVLTALSATLVIH